MSKINLLLSVATVASVMTVPISQAYALTDAVPTVPVVAPDMPMAAPDVKVKPFVPEGAAKEVAAINERLAVLSAQLAELEIQAKIAAKIAEINKFESGDIVTTSTTTSPPPLNMGGGMVPSLPVAGKSGSYDMFDSVMVRDIEGVDGQMSATIILENGNRRVVRKGDKVGDLVITGISVDAVEAKEGKQIINLPFFDDVAQDKKSDQDDRRSPF